nr:helix-turn-helix domain-containing protein [Sorangium cellulosum]
MDERLRFIAQVNESDRTFAELCRRFGISRKTGYKWVERYAQARPSGPEERRPVAHTFPHATPAVIVDVLADRAAEGAPHVGAEEAARTAGEPGSGGAAGGEHHRRAAQEARADPAHRRRVVTPPTAMPTAATSECTRR